MIALGIAVLVLVGLLGLAVGSFLAVAVRRLPRGESLRGPWSACPACGHPGRIRDTVPVPAGLRPGARCPNCREPVPRRNPGVQLATAVLFVLVTAAIGGGAGLPWAVPAFLYLAAISIALALIDVGTHTLPNRIVLPAYPISLLLLAVGSAGSGDWGALVRALAGGAVLFAFYFALAMAYPTGMGFGDVKLAGVLGLYLGWLGWGPLVVGAFGAFLLGGIFSLVLLAAGRVGRKSGIPFGPWMLAGAGVGTLFGSGLWGAYLAFVGMV
jgi:leader peptidase (prepilin peptidase)/N-methyltransferase